MIRLLLFLAALALAAYGLTWLAENPGQVALTWRGVEYDVSLMLALGVVVGLAILLALAWGVIRFVFRLPSLVSLATKARRREKGYAALSRGMVAVGSGDMRAASRHAAEARKLLGGEPLDEIAARASGATRGRPRRRGRRIPRDARSSANPCAGISRPAYRGEAQRRSRGRAGFRHARAQACRAALGGAGGARRSRRARRLAGALESSSQRGPRLIDKPTANRWRAVIKTAMAQDLADRDARARWRWPRRLRPGAGPRFPGGRALRRGIPGITCRAPRASSVDLYVSSSASVSSR